MLDPRHSSSMARNKAEKSSKPVLVAANLAMKVLALAVLALAYAAAPAHAQQCGAQAGGALCPNGLCCSQYGYRGISDEYCGDGCQSQCGVTVGGGGGAAPVKAPQCGAQARGALCPNGLCCSQYGYCGTSSAYCGGGCQSQCGVTVGGGGGAAPVQAPQCGTQARGALFPNGMCCSQYGYCGTTSAYCGGDCQSQCRVSVGGTAPVQAPQCGAQARGSPCPNGLCCSQYGYCGTTSAYCGVGCQSQCRVSLGGAAPVQAPQCGAQARVVLCPNGLCCSQFGYCGTTSDYCGSGCQSQGRVNVGGGGGGVASVVTPELFDRMLPRRYDAACPDRGFYTYDAFLAAARAFPAFGATGDGDAPVAAFMAQASHGTSTGGPSYSGGFSYKEANGATSDYCMPNSQFPCAPNKTYHARGPMQISYNYNYGLASQAIGEDLLRNPDLVATDPVVAFKTALWLWMTPGKANQPSCHTVITELWTATPPEYNSSVPFAVKKAEETRMDMISWFGKHLKH